MSIFFSTFVSKYTISLLKLRRLRKLIVVFNLLTIGIIFTVLFYSLKEKMR
jgi:hypothetical protein